MVQARQVGVDYGPVFCGAGGVEGFGGGDVDGRLGGIGGERGGGGGGGHGWLKGWGGKGVRYLGREGQGRRVGDTTEACDGVR